MTVVLDRLIGARTPGWPITRRRQGNARRGRCRRTVALTTLTVLVLRGTPGRWRMWATRACCVRGATRARY